MPATITSRLATVAQEATLATKASSAPAPSNTIEPYTHGLEGVNLDVDNTLSSAIGIGVAVCIGIFVLLRLWQHTMAWLRLILNLSNSPAQQSYWAHDSKYWPWFKRNILYAPFRHHRHNRELRLGRAYNVGTLPGRMHTVLLGLYMAFNIIACLYLDWTVADKAKLIAELRGRSGHLAVLNMLPLFLFAGRNNLLIPLLKVSFDTWNLFHRWLGRCVVILAVIHTIAWGINKNWDVGAKKANYALAHDPFLTWGLVATIAMSVIMVQSFSVIRHAAYETFLHLHQFLAAAALLGVWYHAKIATLPQLDYIKYVFVLWVLERAARLARIVYRNCKWNYATKVTVEALPADACRVTFELARPWKYTPGCHVYAYLPGVSMWMSHPFSIAWHHQRSAVEDEKLPTSNFDLDPCQPGRMVTSISLIMARRSGMTDKLYKKAAAAEGKVMYMRGAIEGPYGGLESLHSYGTVFLFAGGVGITHQLSHVRDLLQGYEAGRVATRKVVLIWSVKNTEQCKWVEPWMQEILHMANRQEVLTVYIHVTKPRDKREVISPSAKVRFLSGRPNSRAIIAAGMEDRIGAAVATVCGPGGFADEVRAAARANIYKGVLDFVVRNYSTLIVFETNANSA